MSPVQEKCAFPFKKVIGLLAAAALFSALLLKVFSEVALAAPADEVPAFAAPAQILGTYEVEQIELHGNAKRKEKSTLKCPDGDAHCGLKAWVVRTENQLAIIDVPKNAEEKEFKPFLFVPSIGGSKCDRSIGRETALTSLFKSAFCRAIAYQQGQYPGAEAFYFSESLDVKTKVEEFEITPGQILAALPMMVGGTSNYYTLVPKTAATVPPERFYVTWETKFMMLFAPGKTYNTYTFHRVGK